MTLHFYTRTLLLVLSLHLWLNCPHKWFSSVFLASCLPWYSTASAEPSFEHPSPRFTLTCSLKMTTAIGGFCRSIFRVVTGVQLPTAVNTARRGVRTLRIPMAGHGGPWWLIAYIIQFTCTLCWRWKTVDRDDPSRRPPRILAFGHRETRGSWPPGSTGVWPRCSTARG